MRALAITGPRSHPRQVKTFIAAAAGDLCLCESPDAATLARALRGQDAALIFGGDGTLHRHLRVLVDAQVPVLMVPTGSGNDFALACGIRSPAQAQILFHKIRAGELPATTADLGEARFADGASHLFACCLNIGLDADAARRTNLFPDWLKASGGYFIAGIAAILSSQPQPMQIGINDESHPGDMWLACVSNTPTFGGGLPIAPQACIDDGFLECTIVRSTSRWQLVRHYSRILRGKQLGLGFVSQKPAHHVSIASGSPLPVYSDGEYLGSTPVTVRVRKSYLRIFSN